jgi:hypothetical protein
MTPFLLFLICKLVQVSFLGLAVFLSLSFYSHLPVTTLELELFSGAKLNKFIVPMMPSDPIAHLRGPPG